MKQIQALHAVFFEGMEDGLSVLASLVLVTVLLQGRTQRGVIVDLAVEGDPRVPFSLVIGWWPPWTSTMLSRRWAR